MAAYAALVSLAQTTLLIQNQDTYHLSVQALENVRSIHEYVIFMLSFYEDFPEKTNRWEGSTRDLAHKMEDILEHFMMREYMTMKSPTVFLGDQLKDVTEEIGRIAGQMLEERPAYVPAADVSPPSTPPINEAVIGLEKDQTAIKERLCGNSSKLQVIPIVGMAGIGKTTLARAIYEDQLILERFDIRVWFLVSQDYTPHRFGKILLGILDSMNLLEKHLTREKIDESEDEGCENLQKNSLMATQIYQNLKGRRYLIVMDDIWSSKIMDDVRNIFPDDNNGSRIMFTTRLVDVAAYPDPYSSLHRMQLMDGEHSWALLKRKVFADSHCPPDLEEVGKEIVTRCGGLPLAVVLVAGVLSAVSRNRASWVEIVENVSPVFGRDLEGILSLSYTHLPHHLRPCFLYMGGFPKAESIYASRLIKLWVAEGFLKHENRVEEDAENYLEDLVKRNLVIVTSRKSNGKIKKCSLHDTVRDLCIRKAQQEKFLRVVDGCDVAQGLIIGGRRISLNDSNLSDIWGPTIRTILCFQPQNSTSWQAFLEGNKLLRVLSAVASNQEELPLPFPPQAFQLFHLKYLTLIGSFNVPSGISNLVNLETLIISPTIRIRYRNEKEYEYASHFSLPLEIWKMRLLRHVILHDLYMLPDPPSGSDHHPLQNLRTLLFVKNVVWNEELVKMIPNVKKLGLVYTTSRDYHLDHLKDLCQLEKLQVTGYQHLSWSHLALSSTLKKLTLVGGKITWEYSYSVGLLPNLEILKLLANACDVKTWKILDGDFPKLKFLLIEESHFTQWITESSPLPRLERLVIRSCWYLWNVPEAIGEIPTLELIEVAGYCRSTLLESFEQIKEEQESCGNETLQVRTIDSIQLLEEVEEEDFFEVDCAMNFGHSDLISPSTPASNDAVIGLEEDLMAILEGRNGPSSILQFIPIVGMAGIGKTTLATVVYKHQFILEYFDIRAWVVVLRDYTIRKILSVLLDSMKSLEESGEKFDESEEEGDDGSKNMRKQVLGEKIEEPTDMANKIYQKLKGQRYLIVMDDVWSTEVLDDVRNIFPDDNNGSRIMFTTRLADVAAYPDPYSSPHKMQFMDGVQSWILLKRKVFENGDCPPELEGVGKEIARRCAGLPLTIVLVAGVLLSYVNTNRASWEDIARNVSFVSERKLEEILCLSYTHLPHHLRPCFLYMGGFPKDKNIKASGLIKLWVAEGFLKGCSKNSLEEKAEEYLEDLVKRNLVIVTSRKSDGRIKSCSLHDMVRDFCIKKAHEEKFLPIVAGCDIAGCRLLFRRQLFTPNHSNVNNDFRPTIRALLCLEPQNAPSWLAFLEGNILANLFRRQHLRYLALFGSFDVPSAISNLVKLQTLIIHPTTSKRSRKKREYENTSSRLSLPLEIWKMRQLRHLILHYPCMLPHAPPDASDTPLENLQTLLSVKNLVLNEVLVKMVPNVKKLGLVYTIGRDYHLDHLKDLLQLQKLQVTGYRQFSWLKLTCSLPRTLKNLTLVGGKICSRNMDTLGSLPNLEVLKLLANAPDVRTWKIRGGDFPKLKFLLIEDSHFTQWITGSSPLPRLERLVIRSCRYLRNVPEAIGEIPTLELIEVAGYCRSTLLKSVEHIKEEQESCGNETLQVRTIDSIRLSEEEEEEEVGCCLIT